MEITFYSIWNRNRETIRNGNYVLFITNSILTKNKILFL